MRLALTRRGYFWRTADGFQGTDLYSIGRDGRRVTLVFLGVTGSPSDAPVSRFARLSSVALNHLYR